MAELASKAISGCKAQTVAFGLCQTKIENQTKEETKKGDPTTGEKTMAKQELTVTKPGDFLSIAEQGRIVEAAPQMIAFIGKVKDSAVLDECKAQAAAVLEYLAHRRDVSVEEHNAALQIKLKIEHRLGEILARTVKPRAGAGRPSKIGNHALPISGRLPEPITPMQSSRAQQLARAPWSKIEGHIAERTSRNEKASAASVLREIQPAEETPSEEPHRPSTLQERQFKHVKPFNAKDHAAIGKYIDETIQFLKKMAKEFKKRYPTRFGGPDYYLENAARDLSSFSSLMCQGHWQVDLTGDPKANPKGLPCPYHEDETSQRLKELAKKIKILNKVPRKRSGKIQQEEQRP
jgi:hypothetical protein